MRPPPQPVRRAVVDPLAVLVGLVLALLFALAGLAGAVAALWDPRRRLLRIAGFALAYLWVDLTLVAGCIVLWLRHPRRRTDGARQAWTSAHARLLERAFAVLLAAAHRTVGFEVRLDSASEGPPPGRQPLVALARHGGPGDSFTLVWLLLAAWRRVPRVVLTETLRWDPGLDLVLTRLGACFLPVAADADRTRPVAMTAATLEPGQALLLFPEGGNWTPARHRRAVRRLWRRGAVRAARQAAATPRVLPPRPAGTAAVLTARPDLDVIVVAHTGLDRLTTAAQIWRAVPFHGTPMRVRWWRDPASSVPRADGALTDWLNATWADIDGWIVATTSPTTAVGAPPRAGSPMRDRVRQHRPV